MKPKIVKKVDPTITRWHRVLCHENRIVGHLQFEDVNNNLMLTVGAQFKLPTDYPVPNVNPRPVRNESEAVHIIQHIILAQPPIYDPFEL